MKRILLILIAGLFAFSSMAAEPSEVKGIIDGIITKYEKTEGVDCIKFVKGEGIELIKMMLRKEFGRKFMQGVTYIAVIDYSEASEEDCLSLRKTMDQFTSLMVEADMSKSEEGASSDFMRCFYVVSDSGSLSDFLIIVEEGKDKTIMYMSGDIVAELE